MIDGQESSSFDAGRMEQIREMFSRIAPTYDLLNHLLSLGMDLWWRRSAVRSLEQTGALEVLDACGGTGEFARQLRRRLPESRLVVADLARPMLLRAKPKFSSGSRILLAECDALQLPVRDNALHVLTCSFGLRNLNDLEQGLKEFFRVLKPDGELLILEFIGHRNRLSYRLFLLYFRQILPRIGRWVSGHKAVYHYLPRSVEQFVSMEEMSRLLHRHGFQIKKVQDLTFGICTLFYARKRGE